MDIEPFLRGLPKTELHMHLEGSMEPETMFELARRNGMRLRWSSPEELRAAYEFEGLQPFLDLYFEACGVLHAEADFAARLLIDARTEAESVVQATEKSLRSPDYDDIARAEFAPGERDRIDAALAALKAAMPGTDRDAIQQATAALNEATRHLAEVMMNRSVREALAGRNVGDV